MPRIFQCSNNKVTSAAEELGNWPDAEQDNNYSSSDLENNHFEDSGSSYCPSDLDESPLNAKRRRNSEDIPLIVKKGNAVEVVANEKRMAKKGQGEPSTWIRNTEKILRMKGKE